jgi:hypothetical protein
MSKKQLETIETVDLKDLAKATGGADNTGGVQPPTLPFPRPRPGGGGRPCLACGLG